MFIITGSRKFKKVLGTMAERERCVNCAQETPGQIVRIVSWFTFFFIPIFPYSANYYLLCAHCENGYKIDKKEAQSMLMD